MSAVVLFDGLCNFCNASVNFVIRHDSAGYFKFVALQSDVGRELAAEHGLRSQHPESVSDNQDPDSIDSMIVIADGRAYTHSDAGLRIAKNLDGIWSVGYVFTLVPKPIRDLFYRLFARYRYKVFGRADECMIPTPEVRARFL